MLEASLLTLLPSYAPTLPRRAEVGRRRIDTLLTLPRSDALRPVEGDRFYGPQGRWNVPELDGMARDERFFHFFSDLLPKRARLLRLYMVERR